MSLHSSIGIKRHLSDGDPQLDVLMDPLNEPSVPFPLLHVGEQQKAVLLSPRLLNRINHLLQNVEGSTSPRKIGDIYLGTDGIFICSFLGKSVILLL